MGETFLLWILWGCPKALQNTPLFKDTESLFDLAEASYTVLILVLSADSRITGSQVYRTDKILFPSQMF